MLFSCFYNRAIPSEQNAYLKFFSTVRTIAIRFLPFISRRQNRNPAKASTITTTSGALLINLLFRSRTTIKDAIFRFNSHWVHRFSMILKEFLLQSSRFIFNILPLLYKILKEFLLQLSCFMSKILPHVSPPARHFSLSFKILLAGG